MAEDQQLENSQHSNEELELKEYRNEQGEFDIEKIKKLDEEKKYYRKQISQLKQLPEDKAEYSKDFVLDSKFDSFVADEANKKKIDDLFEKIDTMSIEKGINVERNHDIRRFILDELTTNGAIDLTDPATKQQEEQQIIADRNAKIQEFIGEATDREGWDIKLKSWLKTFCNNDAEYALHEKLINTNATWAMSLNKVRQALEGNRIPVIDSDPHYNEAEWNRAFIKADEETQNKMLEERAKKITKAM